MVGCDALINLTKDSSSNNSKNTTNVSVLTKTDIKQVDVRILNPEDNKTVNWYKKDDKTIVMKISSQARLVGVVTLKDETKSSNVIWSSSDNTVANVNDGNVTAKKIGVTTIVAVSTLDPSYKGILNIEVVDDANFSAIDVSSINNVKDINSYVLTPDGNLNDISLLINSSVSGVAFVTLKDKTKNSNVIWESSDNNIAIVDKDGKITAKKIGVTTIVAKYKLNPDYKALINIEVVDKLNDNKTIVGKNDPNLIVSPKIDPKESSIPQVDNITTLQPKTSPTPTIAPSTQVDNIIFVQPKASSTPVPIPSFPSGKIVFSASTNSFYNNNSIYIINSDGSNQTKLIDLGYNYSVSYISHPSLSNDGSKIVFIKDGNKLATMNSDGSNINTLLSTNSGYYSKPRWSSDGSKILFKFYDGLSSEVNIIDKNGNNQRKVKISGITNSNKISLSPDGSKIVFSSSNVGSSFDSNTNLGINIYTCNIDGSNITKLTKIGFFDQASWSPDGSKIVFSGQDNSSYGIGSFLINPDGSNFTLISRERIENTGWSPDGSKILFTEYSSQTNKSEIYTMNPDGTDITKFINTDLFITYVSWGN